MKPPKKKIDRRKKAKRGGRKATSESSASRWRRADEQSQRVADRTSPSRIRHCVIDHRIAQGTRSEGGQRYHERMWTAIATCGKQSRSFFAFLRNSIDANLASQTALSLLTD